MITRDISTHSSDVSSHQPLTRRQVLRTLAATSVALLGGATLASCSDSNTNSNTINVTLVTNGWPVDVMPTADNQKKDPSMKAFADALKKWLDKNPGVKLKTSTVDIWDGSKLVPALSANTAPSWYGSIVLGGYNEVAARRAILYQGLAADLTDLNNKYNITSLMVKSMVPYFTRWNMGGKYYVMPIDFIAGGTCVFYRRDLLQKAGVAEPSATWTMDNFRTTAKALTKDKMRGLALPDYGLDFMLFSEGWRDLTIIPAPKANWHWKFDTLSNQARWLKAINLYRSMYNNDKSILASQGNNDALAPVVNGSAAMMVNNSGFFTQAPSATSLAGMADKMKMPIDDLIGMVPWPVGDGGWIGNSNGGLSTLSLDPHLKKTALSKAYDLYLYFQGGEGFKQKSAGVYQATKDLRQVYAGSINAYDVGSIPGVPGTMEDAWGKKWYQSLQGLLNAPVMPQPVDFIPVDSAAGPLQPSDSQAYPNARSLWQYTTKDAAAALKDLNDTLTQQASTFTSTVSSSDFIAGCQKYYEAMDAFWQKNAPDYYNNVFHPFYQNTIQPVLNG